MTNYKFTIVDAPPGVNGVSSMRGKWSAHLEQCRKLPLDGKWASIEFDEEDGEGALEAGRLATALSSYVRRNYADAGWQFRTKRMDNTLYVQRVSA